MPLYDYQCDHCGKIFTVVLGIREHDRADIRCPGCDSKSVTQCITDFTAKTSKKS